MDCKKLLKKLPSVSDFQKENHTVPMDLKIYRKSLASVADQGCLSRIPNPDFYPSRIPDLGSRIPDPKTATKERGEQK
jgi:hypothetical protein